MNDSTFSIQPISRWSRFWRWITRKGPVQKIGDPITVKRPTRFKKGTNSMAKHVGFKAAQKSIAAKQGISADRAGAILAAGARNASPAAKKANPNLKHVRGK